MGDSLIVNNLSLEVAMNLIFVPFCSYLNTLSAYRIWAKSINLHKLPTYSIMYIIFYIYEQVQAKIKLELTYTAAQSGGGGGGDSGNQGDEDDEDAEDGGGTRSIVLSSVLCIMYLYSSIPLDIYLVGVYYCCNVD